jgi:hypothetical protein
LARVSGHGTSCALGDHAIALGEYGTGIYERALADDQP